MLHNGRQIFCGDFSQISHHSTRSKIHALTASPPPLPLFFNFAKRCGCGRRRSQVCATATTIKASLLPLLMSAPPHCMPSSTSGRSAIPPPFLCIKVMRRRHRISSLESTARRRGGMGEDIDVGGDVRGERRRKGRGRRKWWRRWLWWAAGRRWRSTKLAGEGGGGSGWRSSHRGLKE